VLPNLAALVDCFHLTAADVLPWIAPPAFGTSCSPLCGVPLLMSLPVQIRALWMCLERSVSALSSPSPTPLCAPRPHDSPPSSQLAVPPSCSVRLLSIALASRFLLSIALVAGTPSLLRTLSYGALHALLTSSPLRLLVLGGERFPSQSEWRRWLTTGTDPVTVPRSLRCLNIYGITEQSIVRLLPPLPLFTLCLR